MHAASIRQATTLCSSLVLFLSAVAIAADKPAASAESRGWPQFLGPDRNGVSAETGLLNAWPKDGPKEVWRVPGGEGMSGLAISGGRLFTLVQKEGQQLVLCLNAQTGKANWEQVIAPAYANSMGDGPRGTPAVAGDLVFAFTGDGRLVALQTSDGKVAWSKDVLAQFGGKPTDYGMACSPLVTKDKVIVTLGAPQATVAAFDTKTGAVAWSWGQDSPPGYSSPALLKVAGREQVVAFHGTGAVGLDPAKGTPLWTYPYETDFNCNIATPLAVNDGVFLSAGENHGSVLLGLKPKGDVFTVSPVWSSLGPKSILRNEWQTSILLDGNLYGFDNVGGAGPISHLTCVDAQTGKQKWQKLRFGKGNMTAADGKLFIATIDGDLVIVKASPDKFEELGRKPYITKTRQAPALVGGLLYLRDSREIVCVDVRK